ncbi:MAG: PstS family phosphate ABC transporter substrate-binding protein [Myxococcales bacterium]|nr:PstS family phosphate ABC transporter substrate-binding protein [Myxococcales bacterium]
MRVIVCGGVLALTLLLFGSACKKDNDGSSGGGAQVISIDGSSTVFPITEAIAEEFRKMYRDVRITIGVSGTGGGFKKFCSGEIDITGASRPIKPSELKLCADNSIEYIELPVAFDGIAIVVHPTNDWADPITVAELKKIWEPEAQGQILRWNQIRANWPDKEIHLFGAGVDSGTYDYFTAAITGKEHSSRGDFTSSEDDNVLVQGVSTDPLALGFFGFAYYNENSSKITAVGVDDSVPAPVDGPVKPNLETIAGGQYQPLSRPIFIYVNKKAADREIIQKFIEYYTSDGAELVKEVGYIPLPETGYEMVRKRFADRRTGSVFEGKGAQVGVRIEDLLKVEGQ